jgi:hypothetical protein
MTALRAAVVLVGAGGMLLVGACTDVAERTGPSAPAELQQVSPLQELSEDDPVELARGVSGFGGFFLDARGRPTVYLTDARARGAAAQALAPFLRSRGLDASTLQVVRGDFGYDQLDRWFQRASPAALELPGAVFADLDEGANRLRIGVRPGPAAARVRAALARVGIPASAVVIQESAPIVQLRTLRDKFRPVVGGVQIDIILGICSMGFNAVSGGVRSFITASHCTYVQGGTENTVFMQPVFFDLTGDPTIGTEAADPLYGRRTGCPVGRVCRFSDAARAVYAPKVTSTLGLIARTTGPNNGSLVEAGSFQITREKTGKTFVVGDLAHKVGRTTGWTRAAITSTCVNVDVDGTNITQLCQTLASAPSVVVGAGDSGSPVFLYNGNAGYNVTLAGILWGGSADGTLFAFSPLANIQRANELGPLVTCVAGATHLSCAP